MHIQNLLGGTIYWANKTRDLESGKNCEILNIIATKRETSVK